MIAAKSDGIWERLSATFYDSLGKPYPPYARSSCARWFEVSRDEAVGLGVIDAKDGLDTHNAYLLSIMFDDPSKVTPADLKAKKDGLIAALAMLEKAKLPTSQQQRKQEARLNAEYESSNQRASEERGEKNSMFRLLEDVELSLRETPVIRDERRWNWLCDSLAKLTATQYFDEYPNWRSRAWAASATMYGSISMPADELACLTRALELNPKLAAKRRIKVLERLVNGSEESKPL
jgi:hypothetical protein